MSVWACRCPLLVEARQTYYTCACQLSAILASWVLQEAKSGRLLLKFFWEKDGVCSPESFKLVTKRHAGLQTKPLADLKKELHDAFDQILASAQARA